ARQSNRDFHTIHCVGSDKDMELPHVYLVGRYGDCRSTWPKWSHFVWTKWIDVESVRGAYHYCWCLHRQPGLVRRCKQPGGNTRRWILYRHFHREFAADAKFLCFPDRIGCVWRSVGREV